jgi:hypothetical protein
MATLQIATAENSLKMLAAARSEIREAFDYNPATNLFGKDLPEWVGRLSADLHAAEGHLINAIDPNGDRPHGWWESI